MSLEEDLKIVKDAEETFSDVELDNAPVSEEEAMEIEKQLIGLYKRKINEAFIKKEINIRFERAVKVPLYLALFEYFGFDKAKCACVLGIKRDKLTRVMIAYFNTGLMHEIQAAEKNSSLYYLYLNYLGQFYINTVDGRFGDIVNRAKLIAVMEYCKDNLYLASETLGMRMADITKELMKYFGATKLCDIDILTHLKEGDS